MSEVGGGTANPRRNWLLAAWGMNAERASTIQTLSAGTRSEITYGLMLGLGVGVDVLQLLYPARFRIAALSANPECTRPSPLRSAPHPSCFHPRRGSTRPHSK